MKENRKRQEKKDKARGGRQVKRGRWKKEKKKRGLEYIYDMRIT